MKLSIEIREKLNAHKMEGAEVYTLPAQHVVSLEKAQKI
jgi:hypothetical protein